MYSQSTKKNTYIPPELQYLILSFAPEIKMQYVCKSWHDETKMIRTQYVNVISNWLKRILKSRDIWKWDGIIAPVMPLTNWMSYVPKELYMNYPECIVAMLGLSSVILSVIPLFQDRKRIDVYNWLNNFPTDLMDDFRLLNCIPIMLDNKWFFYSSTLNTIIEFEGQRTSGRSISGRSMLGLVHMFENQHTELVNHIGLPNTIIYMHAPVHAPVHVRVQQIPGRMCGLSIT